MQEIQVRTMKKLILITLLGIISLTTTEAVNVVVDASANEASSPISIRHKRNVLEAEWQAGPGLRGRVVFDLSGTQQLIIGPFRCQRVRTHLSRL